MESVAGMLLALLLIALVIAFTTNGLGGVGAWLHAKFVGGE